MKTAMGLRSMGGALLLAAACLAPPAAAAQAVPEYALKAAFLYSFAQFVEWPAQERPAAAFPLCVIGQDPFGAALDALEGKVLRGRRVVVRRLDSADAAGECQVLFLAASEEGRMGAVLEALKGRPVLTVAESDGWIEQGVMINLSTRGARLVFDINLEAARQAGLRVSSRLLRLAHSVVGK